MSPSSSLQEYEGLVIFSVENRANKFAFGE